MSVPIRVTGTGIRRLGAALLLAAPGIVGPASAFATAVFDYGLNLLENPSFESHPKIKRNKLEVFPDIPGWTSSLGHIPLHDGNSGQLAARDGDTKLDLDAPFNTEVAQDIATAPGRRYQLELFYAPGYQKHATDSNDVEVRWNDEIVGVLTGDERYWRRHLLDVAAVDDLSRLTLRGAGKSDGRGGLIDMVSLLEVPYVTGNLVENGSFEMGEVDGHHGKSGKHGEDAIAAWQAGDDGVALERHGAAGVAPYEGEVLLSLYGSDPGAVSQTLALEPGAWYELEVFYSPRRASGKDAVAVTLDDRRLGDIAGEKKNWQRRRFTFEADAANSLLTLGAPRCTEESKHGQGPSHGYGYGYGYGREHDGDDCRDPDDGDHEHGHGGNSKHGDDDDHRHDGHGHKSESKHHDDDDDDGDSKNRGGFVDNVRLYGVCRGGDNLIINHSFEIHDPVGGNGQGIFPGIPGWQADLGIIEIHQDGFGGRSLMAAEGIAHVQLGAEGNRAIRQAIETEPGVDYELHFAYSPRVEDPGTHRNDLEVYWDGERLAILGGDRKGWQFHRFRVTASGDQTTLRFLGVGARAGMGAQIDEVRLFRAADTFEIVSDPVTGAEAGSPYAYQVLLAPPGEARFTLAEAPLGMTIDEDGVVAWALPVEGAHRVTVEVRDTCATVLTQTWTLVVVDASNAPPVITSTPVTSTELFAVRPQVTVEDATGVTRVIRLNGEPYVPGTPITADGDYTLEVQATDAAGNVSMETIPFTINRNATQ